MESCIRRSRFEVSSSFVRLAEPFKDVYALLRIDKHGKSRAVLGLLQLVPLDTEEAQETTKGEEEEECLVCQEEMSKEHVAQLVCGHIFHKSCISSWLRRKASCPMYAHRPLSQVSWLPQAAARWRYTIYSCH